MKRNHSSPPFSRLNSLGKQRGMVCAWLSFFFFLPLLASEGGGEVPLIDAILPPALLSPQIDGSPHDLAWRAPAARLGKYKAQNGTSWFEVFATCDPTSLYLLLHLGGDLFSSPEQLAMEIGYAATPTRLLLDGTGKWMMEEGGEGPNGGKNQEGGIQFASREENSLARWIEIAIPRRRIHPFTLQEGARVFLRIRPTRGKKEMALDFPRGLLLGSPFGIRTVSLSSQEMKGTAVGWGISGEGISLALPLLAKKGIRWQEILLPPISLEGEIPFRTPISLRKDEQLLPLLRYRVGEIVRLESLSSSQGQQDCERAEKGGRIQAVLDLFRQEGRRILQPDLPEMLTTMLQEEDETCRRAILAELTLLAEQRIRERIQKEGTPLDDAGEILTLVAHYLTIQTLAERYQACCRRAEEGRYSLDKTHSFFPTAQKPLLFSDPETEERLRRLLLLWSEETLPGGRFVQWGRRRFSHEIFLSYAEKVCREETVIARFRPEGSVAIPRLSSYPPSSGLDLHVPSVVLRPGQPDLASVILLSPLGWSGSEQSAMYGAFTLATSTHDLIVEPRWNPSPEERPLWIPGANPPRICRRGNRWVVLPAFSYLRLESWATEENPPLSYTRCFFMPSGPSSYLLVADAVETPKESPEVCQTLTLGKDAASQLLVGISEKARIQYEHPSLLRFRWSSARAEGDSPELLCGFLLSPSPLPLQQGPGKMNILTWEAVSAGSAGGWSIPRKEGEKDYLFLHLGSSPFSSPSPTDLQGIENAGARQYAGLLLHAFQGEFAFLRLGPGGWTAIGCVDTTHLAFTHQGGRWEFSFSAPATLSFALRPPQSLSASLDPFSMPVTLELSVTYANPASKENSRLQKARVHLFPGRTLVFQLLESN